MTSSEHVQSLLQRPPAYDVPAAEPAAIRARGQRIRHRRRVRATAVLAAAAAATAIAVGVELNPSTTARPVGPVNESAQPRLNAYEKRVLASVPGSYHSLAGAVVVVPGAARGSVGGSGPSAPVVSPERIVSPLRPLGFQLSRQLREVPTAQRYPSFMDTVPDDVDLRVESGPTWIACVLQIGGTTCAPTVLGRTTSGTPYVLDSLGYGAFVTRGAKVRVLVGDDFRRDGLVETMIGAVPGTATARVEVVLYDGTRVRAQVDHTAGPGTTYFWTHTRKGFRSVRAYTASGDLVTALYDLSSCDQAPCTTEVGP